MSQQMPGWQGNDPRAQAKADKAYRKALRPFYKKKRFIFPALFVLLIVVIAVSSGSKTGSTTASAPAAASIPASSKAPVTAELSDAAKNVAVTKCDVQSLGGTSIATVGYTINNPTSKSSTYLLEFAVIDSTKAKVASANGLEPAVLPGRPSQGEAVGNVSSSAVAPFTCEVGNVTRTADN